MADLRLKWEDGKAVCGAFRLTAEIVDGLPGCFCSLDLTYVEQGGGFIHIKTFHKENQLEAQLAAETALKDLINTAFWQLHEGDVEKAAEEIEKQYLFIAESRFGAVGLPPEESRTIITAIITKHLGKPQ